MFNDSDALDANRFHDFDDFPQGGGSGVFPYFKRNTTILDIFKSS